MIIGKLLRDETGASAIEYVVIIALVAITLVTAVSSLGTETANTYTEAGNSMGGASQSEPEPESLGLP